MSLIHRHHIIPRHAGGTDDPTNIVLLTVEEHAEAHRLLFEQYGRHQDYMAWKLLSYRAKIGEDVVRKTAREASIIARNTPGKREAWIEKIKVARSKQIITEQTRKKLSDVMKNRVFTDEHRVNLSKAMKGVPRPSSSRPCSEEKKEKISAANKGKLKGRKMGPQSEETRRRKSEAARAQHARQRAAKNLQKTTPST